MAGNQSIQETPYLNYLSDKIQKGGWGGIAQIIIILVASIYLLIYEDQLKILMWNIFIVNLPSCIDGWSLYKKIPEAITPGKWIKRAHAFVVFLLLISLAFGGLLLAIMLNQDNTTSTYLLFEQETCVLKGSLFLNVFWLIIKYEREFIMIEAHDRELDKDSKEKTI